MERGHSQCSHYALQLAAKTIKAAMQMLMVLDLK